MIPLYGFLEGDTIGLLVLAEDELKLSAIAERVQLSARTRVAPGFDAVVLRDGVELSAELTVRQAGLAPLDRIDVRRRAAP